MENVYYIIIITAIIFEFLLSSLSSLLDIKNITSKIPESFKKAYNQEKYVKSQQYLKARTRFGLFSNVFSFSLILFVIHSELFGILDNYVRNQTESYIFQGLLFIGIIYFIQDIISLPFSIYNTFIIEEKFGFNKSTIKLFFIDKIKGYLIFLILGSLILTPILYFFYSFSEFGWVIAWLILIVFMIGLQPLFVHIIAPMFNKFTPLEDGELRSEIEKYSSKVDFPLSRIDVMDGSKRSAHSNAYFTGFGKSRRIAIFDTLIDKHSTKEIVSVVAHEVGHYKLKHIFQGIIIGIIETGIMLFCFNLIMKDVSLFHVFGVNQISVHGGLVFFSMLYAPVNMITSIFTTAISRKNEYEADRYSFDTTKDADALKSMLIGLSANNLSHLTPHPLKVFLSYSHPPVIDRINAIENYA